MFGLLWLFRGNKWIIEETRRGDDWRLRSTTTIERHSEYRVTNIAG